MALEMWFSQMTGLVWTKVDRAVGTAQAAQAMAWALFPICHFAHAQFHCSNSTNRILGTLKFNSLAGQTRSLMCANSSTTRQSNAVKPHHLVAFNFPKTDYGKQAVVKQSFQESWLAKWSWLQVMTVSFAQSFVICVRKAFKKLKMRAKSATNCVFDQGI